MTEPAAETPDRLHVDLLLAGGWMLTMNPRREVYRDGAVAITGTRIADVGRREDLVMRFRATRTIDTSRSQGEPDAYQVREARRA